MFNTQLRKIARLKSIKCYHGRGANSCFIHFEYNYSTLNRYDCKTLNKFAWRLQINLHGDSIVMKMNALHGGKVDILSGFAMLYIP